MARTPKTTPAIPDTTREDEVLIREIDEAVREDALYEFLRTQGLKVLGVIGLGIAGLGGYLIWDHYAEQNLEAQSETLIAALDAAGTRVGVHAFFKPALRAHGRALPSGRRRAGDGGQRQGRRALPRDCR